jgi:hypothetical protein
MALSYPKSRINAVLLGRETFATEPYFKLEGYNVIKRDSLTNKALTDLKNASIIVSSLKQEITNLNNFPKLISLAVWGNNNQQFNASIAQRMAVPIFSSPYANTRSVVELGLGFMFQLSRQTNTELRGKKIGIISLSKEYPIESQNLVILSQNADLNEAAQKLYAALHYMDALNLDLILTEPMPNIGIGMAMHDRLERAASKFNQ